MSFYTNLKNWHEHGVTTLPVGWAIGREDTDLIIWVPVGFRFDVSVPRFWRWFVDPAEPKYQKAACLHDWLLEDGWDRVTAAAIFHQALQADGVGRWRRLLMFLAVVLFKWR